MKKGILLIWVRSIHSLSNCNVLTSVGRWGLCFFTPSDLDSNPFLRLLQSIKKMTSQKPVIPTPSKTVTTHVNTRLSIALHNVLDEQTPSSLSYCNNRIWSSGRDTFFALAVSLCNTFHGKRDYFKGRTQIKEQKPTKTRQQGEVFPLRLGGVAACAQSSPWSYSSADHLVNPSTSIAMLKGPNPKWFWAFLVARYLCQLGNNFAWCHAKEWPYLYHHRPTLQNEHWRRRCPGDPESSPPERVYHRNIYLGAGGVTSRGGVLTHIWGGRGVRQGRIAQSWGTHTSHSRSVWAGGPARPNEEGCVRTPQPERGMCVCTQICVHVAHVGISYRRWFTNL